MAVQELPFNPTEIETKLIGDRANYSAEPDAVIFLTSVLEYLSTEITEQALCVTRSRKKRFINADHITTAIRTDEDLRIIFDNFNFDVRGEKRKRDEDEGLDLKEGTRKILQKMADGKPYFTTHGLNLMNKLLNFIADKFINYITEIDSEVIEVFTVECALIDIFTPTLTDIAYMCAENNIDLYHSGRLQFKDKTIPPAFKAMVQNLISMFYANSDTQEAALELLAEALYSVLKKILHNAKNNSKYKITDEDLKKSIRTLFPTNLSDRLMYEGTKLLRWMNNENLTKK